MALFGPHNWTQECPLLTEERKLRLRRLPVLKRHSKSAKSEWFRIFRSIPIAGRAPCVFDLRCAKFQNGLLNRCMGEASMKGNFKVGLGILVGFGLGAVVVEQLHAQAKPPAYVISEIDVTNADAYAKEYVPLANKALAESGQKRLVSGGKTISLAGDPPAARIVVSIFESMENAQAAYTSPAYIEARKIGDKYGKLRIFAVEGIQ